MHCGYIHVMSTLADKAKIAKQKGTVAFGIGGLGTAGGCGCRKETNQVPTTGNTGVDAAKKKNRARERARPKGATG